MSRCGRIFARVEVLTRLDRFDKALLVARDGVCSWQQRTGGNDFVITPPPWQRSGKMGHKLAKAPSKSTTLSADSFRKRAFVALVGKRNTRAILEALLRALRRLMLSFSR